MSPSSISPESELVAESGGWVHVVNGSALLWPVIAVAAIVGIGWLLQ